MRKEHHGIFMDNFAIAQLHLVILGVSPAGNQHKGALKFLLKSPKHCIEDSLHLNRQTQGIDDV
jgi:hypothetical protein